MEFSQMVCRRYPGQIPEREWGNLFEWRIPHGGNITEWGAVSCPA